MLLNVITRTPQESSHRSFRGSPQRATEESIFFLFGVVLLTFFLFCSFYIPQNAHAQSDDIYEDSDAFGLDHRQEKEDETFFYFGRFFMLGAETGVRTFTGNLGAIYEPGLEIGTYATYFMTLGFSLELMLDYSWHNFVVDNISGTVSLLNVNVNGKYYITSTEFNRALAYANPYVFAGFGQYFRFTGSDAFRRETKENAFGVDFGAGFEFPLSERKLYAGFKTIFHWIFFKDEHMGSVQGTPLDGDAVSFLLTLNYNF
ncbi:MAG: outer membrane beta-barrel protein [Deltaproteobacteria bacterium]|nr:outer membrane beta-barrel protein [Deltaproteobacteria bacterium]